jgi:hypothetical protein
LSNGRLSDAGRPKKPNDASAPKEVEEPGKELVLDSCSCTKVALRRREAGSSVKNSPWCASARKALENWQSALIFLNLYMTFTGRTWLNVDTIVVCLTNIVEG